MEILGGNPKLVSISTYKPCVYATESRPTPWTPNAKKPLFPSPKVLPLSVKTPNSPIPGIPESTILLPSRVPLMH